MTSSTRRSSKALLLCLAFTAFFTWLDLWTKDLAKANLPCDPEAGENCRLIPGRAPARAGGYVLVDGYLDLAYAENRGAAFSMLHDAPEWVRIGLFSLATVVACVGMSWMFVVGHGGALYAYSVPLILSGAIGNLVDRYRYGYVVDFIRFHIHDGWEYPIFNVADITIFIGAALLIIDSFRKTPQPYTAAAEANS